MDSINSRIAEELGVRPQQVEAAVGLLDEGSTVPFIARYRKEVTGSLDDTQLRHLEERLRYLRELDERRASILASIEEQGKLTPELAREIKLADTKTRLEDLYLPYKQKRRTKAQIAIEAGLAPLAESLLGDPSQNPEEVAARYLREPFANADGVNNPGVLDAKAALDGARQIKERLTAHAARMYEVEPSEVSWEAGGVRVGAQHVDFDELVASAYMERVQLSAAGFYKTPKIHWDRATGRGHPFYYFAYGAAVSEVSIDTLTGEYHVDRVDILHDVGKSLNPAIDLGQIEGGFIQGMGWLTTEELWWDDKGQLRTHAPSTYKIPLASDVPPVFNVKIAEWSSNREPTVGRSKAVGEPPLMLAVSVVEALGMAVASVADYRIAPRLDTPVTPERVLMGVERMRKAAG